MILRTITIASIVMAALTLLSDDPGLEKPENRGVLLKVRQMFADTPDIFN